MRIVLIIAFLNAVASCAYGQPYKDSILRFQQQYVQDHEVVKSKDKKHFRFFAPTEHYKVIAVFEKTEGNAWAFMETSGTIKEMYRVYGVLHFIINDTAVQLNIYQSKDLMQSAQYKDYLFLPFTDVTSGEATYASGRYLDLTISNIKNNSVVLDFNKAYNPYCAYVSGVYNCPIPPPQNRLPVAINAGEMAFAEH